MDRGIYSYRSLNLRNNIRLYTGIYADNWAYPHMEASRD